MQKSSIQKINWFLRTYKIRQITDEITVLECKQGKLIIKTEEILEEHLDKLEKIQQKLDQYLSLDEKYFLPLLHFQTYKDHQHHQYLRIISSYGETTLSEEIYNRANHQQPFQEEELWVLISSIVESLLHLENKQINYQSLNLSHIFVDQNIRLLNPSIFISMQSDEGLLPLQHKEDTQIQQLQQIFQQQEGRSEVSAQVPAPKPENRNIIQQLGQCILSAIMLVNNLDATSLQIQNLQSNIFPSLQDLYSQELLHLLTNMLKQPNQSLLKQPNQQLLKQPNQQLLKEPNQKQQQLSLFTFLTVQDIKSYLSNEIHLRETSLIDLQHLAEDCQELPNQNLSFQENHQVQKIDLLEDIEDIEDIEFIEFQSRKKIDQIKSKYLSSEIRSICQQYSKKKIFKQTNCSYHEDSERKIDQKYIMKKKEGRGLNKIKQIKNRKINNIQTAQSITIQSQNNSKAQLKYEKCNRNQCMESKQWLNKENERIN